MGTCSECEGNFPLVSQDEQVVVASHFDRDGVRHCQGSLQPPITVAEHVPD